VFKLLGQLSKKKVPNEFFFTRTKKWSRERLVPRSQTEISDGSVLWLTYFISVNLVWALAQFFDPEGQNFLGVLILKLK
jgi:hypothetical protein